MRNLWCGFLLSAAFFNFEPTVHWHTGYKWGKRYEKVKSLWPRNFGPNLMFKPINRSNKVYACEYSFVNEFSRKFPVFILSSLKRDRKIHRCAVFLIFPSEIYLHHRQPSKLENLSAATWIPLLDTSVRKYRWVTRDPIKWSPLSRDLCIPFVSFTLVKETNCLKQLGYLFCCFNQFTLSFDRHSLWTLLFKLRCNTRERKSAVT